MIDVSDANHGETPISLILDSVNSDHIMDSLGLMRSLDQRLGQIFWIGKVNSGPRRRFGLILGGKLLASEPNSI